MSHIPPGIDRDECFGLGWNGLMPSGAGAEIRRVRLEQLGLLLTPNALKPTELVDKVLLGSKAVRDAFFTFMTMAGCYSLTDMYEHLQPVLPPLPEDGDDVSDTFPYLYRAKLGRPLIDPHSAREDQLFTQTDRPNPPPPTSAEKHQRYLEACDVFHQTLAKAITRQATKVRGGMAHSLDDVRVDDVWGNFFYLPSALKHDVSNIVLQVLLLDWFAVATTEIPHVLKQMQLELTPHIPYGYNPFTDLFYRLRGHIAPDAPAHGGYDQATFATLLHMQQDPSAETAHSMPAQLYHNELTRMWASAEMRNSIGRVMAAIWEETSRDVSEGGTGCDVTGVILSLCYALTTESVFMLGSPAMRQGTNQTDSDGRVERDYGRERPVLPDDVYGTSWRIIDAVRIALRRGYGGMEYGSYLATRYVAQLPSDRQLIAVFQGVLWHAILDWFAIERLPMPPHLPTNLPTIPSRAVVARPEQAEQDGMAAEDDGSLSDYVSMDEEEDEQSETETTSADADEEVSTDADMDADDENEESTMPVPVLTFRIADGSLDMTNMLAEYDDATPPSSPMRLPQADEDSLSTADAGDQQEDEEDEQPQQPQQTVYLPAPRQPLSDFQVSDVYCTVNYTTRPHQLNLTELEAAAQRRVRDREAHIHGIGPYLYVAASGEHDHIVLPPHLVDSRRISGNADGVMTRQLVVETMPSAEAAATTTHMDADDAQAHANIARALRAAFPFAPPLREPFLPSVSIKKQKLTAVVRSMQLQLAHTPAALSTPEALQEALQGLETLLGDCPPDVCDYALMDAVANFGWSLNIDLRLGILTDNRVPELGDGAHIYPRHPTAETRFVWVYRSNTRRFKGPIVWDESFQALKPMDSIVGHGRESHFWLGIRQEVFRTWRI